ncbi:hypothetical protein ACXZ65_34370 [Streptomyces aculeolatus]
MGKKTLPREPWRGSQVCGYQIQIGSWHNSGNIFCGERKEHGLYACREHHQAMAEDEPDGRVRMAPGNAIGSRNKPVRLQWEPSDGSRPVEPTKQEVVDYPVG